MSNLRLYARPVPAAANVGGTPASAAGPPGGGPPWEDDPVLVIAHRGASGYRPEHTLAAYELAIEQGADHIEPDLVPTRDGILVARHESEISRTTDVAEHPELADRFTTKVVDGVRLSGWFTEDLTLAELKTLRATERIPDLRPQNAAYDGCFEIPTLQEVIDLARASRTRAGRPVGLYLETKHPSYFASLGLSMEEELVRVLHANGYHGRGAPVFLQSFEVGNLQQLAQMTSLPLVQLVGCPAARAGRDPGDDRDLVSPGGLSFVAGYADAIGACKDLLVPRRPGGTLGRPSPLIEQAHELGLLVHGWTFRRENRFLPLEHRHGGDPGAPGDVIGELAAFLAAGIDGFFTDNPDLGALVRALSSGGRSPGRAAVVGSA